MFEKKQRPPIDLPMGRSWKNGEATVYKGVKKKIKKQNNMMKKFLLMMLITMLVCMGGAQKIWAAAGDHDAQLNIQKVDEYTVVPNYTKFAEPLVTVTKVEGGVTTTLTNKYIIKYYINGHEGDDESTMAVNSRKAKVTRDTSTGTEVELLFGNVVFGSTEGNVTIKVIATPVNSSNPDTPSSLNGEYTVTVAAPVPVVSFSPSFPKDGDDNDMVSLFVNQTITEHNWYGTTYAVKLTGSTAALPKAKVTLDGVDITEHYDITATVTPATNNTPDKQVSIVRNTKGDIIKFAETYTPSDLSTLELAKAFFPANATLTYTFVKKDDGSSYANISDKVIPVKFAHITDDDLEDGKLNLHLGLTAETFLQEKVTSEDIDGDGNNDYVIHVYKYGQQDHKEEGKYQYLTPNPAILSATGGSFPIYCSRGTGAYGDMQLFYQLIDGNDKKDVYAGSTQLGTYYDDCGTLPFYSSGEIVEPGKSTGLTISEHHFQSGKPGLVKVAVYGVLPKDPSYAYDLKQLLQAKQENDADKILKDQWGAEYIVYTDPVYFYIDVMKRIPTLAFDPDPSKMIFGTGDKIDMKNRFNVSGSITNECNGIAGDLTWGANTGNFEDDHFAYTFFISDHAAQVIKVNDWPTNFTKEEGGKTVKDEERWIANTWEHPYTHEIFHGDQYSFRSYKELDDDDNIVKAGVKVMKGDKILVGDDLVEITDVNYETYKDHVLAAGDMVAGTTYNSVKGFGEAFEKWTITFEHEGKYEIEYTIRPWNHTRWDIGSNEKGTTTYTYEIKDKVDTELLLSYYETTTEKNSQWTFDEPVATVVLASSHNDVTEHFNIHYNITSGDNKTDGYTISEETNPDGHTGTYVVYKKGSDVVLMVNKDNGEVFVGNIEEDVNIRVSATAKTLADEDKYNNPSDKIYTIHVKDFSLNAKWDIMSTCKTVNPDAQPTTGTKRFTDAEFNQQMGRFHYVGEGTIIGGTQVRGVPGIMMTVGASGDNTWQAIASDKSGLPLCCNHEENNVSGGTKSAPVIVKSTADLGLDADGHPVSGTFYQFNPTASGILTLDANFTNGSAIVLMKRDAKTEKVVEIDRMEITADATSDKTFTKPLVAGETYYVYNSTTGALRLHGFKYEPKFLIDDNTTVTEGNDAASSTVATLFMNGFASGIPTFGVGENLEIEYDVTFDDGTKTKIINGNSENISNYVTIDSKTGQLTAKKMTINTSGAEATIFNLKVTATVHTTDITQWGDDCTQKTSFYYLQIIDIPTYKLDDYETYQSAGGVENCMKVRTTNIPTAITMTFGGWAENGEGADQQYNDFKKQDQWSYKSVAGPSSRIGSERDDDDPYYNLSIDGFGFYNAGNQNPVDELNKGALIKAGSGLNNGSTYQYASGTEAEKSNETYYNTTYRLPCRGSFVKFEPEESGILLVYLVQNGSVDYHHGIANISKEYQLKWRPLYITDETGKPVTMVGEAGGGNFSSVSKYLPTGGDTGGHVGYYTRCLSRCNKVEPAIEEAMGNVTSKQLYGTGDNKCSFDWTEFRGTDADKDLLLAAWKSTGEREDIIRLANKGFALPHKAYVRYAFEVKAGKTYFVFQPGSKFEFGGFSFVPDGYPTTSKYGLTWTDKSDADMMKWTAPTNANNKETDVNLTWTNGSFTANDNINVTLIDAASGDKKRTFSKDKWNSICLPFSVSESQLKKKFGEDYVLVTVDGVNDKGQLQFLRHANGYIEAGRPYLFKPTVNCKTESDGDYDHLTFENVTIESDVNATTIGGTQNIVDPSRFEVSIEGDYIFKGFYSQHDMPQGCVYAAADGLYKYDGTGSGSIGGYRALFDLPSAGPQDPGAKALTFCITDLSQPNSDIDQTTGIVYVTKDDVKVLNPKAGIYTLDGKKIGEGADDLNKLGRGIYIIDGQKIVR